MWYGLSPFICIPYLNTFSSDTFHSKSNKASGKLHVHSFSHYNLFDLKSTGRVQSPTNRQDKPDNELSALLCQQDKFRRRIASTYCTHRRMRKHSKLKVYTSKLGKQDKPWSTSSDESMPEAAVDCEPPRRPQRTRMRPDRWNDFVPYK